MPRPLARREARDGRECAHEHWSGWVGRARKRARVICSAGAERFEREGGRAAGPDQPHSPRAPRILARPRQLGRQKREVTPLAKRGHQREREGKSRGVSRCLLTLWPLPVAPPLHITYYILLWHASELDPPTHSN
eukprot:scaffold19505_cov33-Tisochrysis_lutea.AAC.1